jgi:hypothetical protein
MMPEQIATELEQLATEPFPIAGDFVQVPQDLYGHWRRVSVEAAEAIRNYTGGADR